jgi:hypothetical protein
MTVRVPLAIVRLEGDHTHCLVIVAPNGHPTARAIDPAEIVGQFELIDGQPNMAPSAFVRGKDFTDFLHASIASHGPATLGLVEAAKGQHDTYVYVIDGRTPTPQGSVPLEDIIGSFRVAHGEISSDAYERFGKHQLYTERGFFQLDPALMGGLLADLARKCGAP